MKRQIRLVHRCYRMTAHRRMTIDSPCIPVCGREQISENDIASKRRCSNQNRHALGSEHTSPDLDRPADIAHIR